MRFFGIEMIALFPSIDRNRVFKIHIFKVTVQHFRDFSLQLGDLQNAITNIVEAGIYVNDRSP